MSRPRVPMFRAHLRLRLTSANTREHWRARSRRCKRERGIARMACVAARYWFSCSAEHPLTVTFTRVAPRPLDDDNLAFACKALRDGVADALGLRSDNLPCVRWHYQQRRGNPGEYAVEIRIEPPVTSPAQGEFHQLGSKGAVTYGCQGKTDGAG